MCAYVTIMYRCTIRITSLSVYTDHSPSSSHFRDRSTIVPAPPPPTRSNSCSRLSTLPLSPTPVYSCTRPTCSSTTAHGRVLPRGFTSRFGLTPPRSGLTSLWPPAITVSATRRVPSRLWTSVTRSLEGRAVKPDVLLWLQSVLAMTNVD